MKKKNPHFAGNDEQKKSIDIKLNQSSSYSQQNTKTGHELKRSAKIICSQTSFGEQNYFITNSTLVSFRIVQHLLPVENNHQKFCTTANFGQTCLLYHKIQISLST